MKKQIQVFILLFITIKSFGQTPSYVSSDHLKGWYPFSGNTIDSSLNGNDLVNVGGVGYTNDRNGKSNSSTTFNGTSQFLNLFSSTLPSGNSNRTISFWYKYRGDFDSTSVLIGFWDGVSSGSCLTSYTLGHLPKSGYYFWGRCDDKDWDIGYKTDIWYHMVSVYKNDTIYLYRNDTLINNIVKPLDYYSFKTPLSTSIHEFTVGTGWTSGHSYNSIFKGEIDDIGIWNRSLSRCEISKLHHSSKSLIVEHPKNDTVKSSTVSIFTIKDTGGVGSTYQWEENRGSGFVVLTNTPPYSGVNTKVLTINPVNISMNNYQYRCIKNSNPCFDTSNSGRLIIKTNSIYNVVKEDFKTYPNPTESSVRISSPILVEYIQVFNLLGQLLFSKSVRDNVVDVEMGSFVSGIYLIKINNQYSLKVTKN